MILTLFIPESTVFEYGHLLCCKFGSQYVIENSMANSVHPDETALYLVWSARLKSLNCFNSQILKLE